MKEKEILMGPVLYRQQYYNVDKENQEGKIYKLNRQLGGLIKITF